jgi:phosphatidylserine/phosphatidylglycerophosphate/cardiolipin synthase-like enzyme
MMFEHRGSPVVTGLQSALLRLCLWLSAASAHEDHCHRLYSGSSDHKTNVCGDKGRCNHCPNHQYCLAGKPRMAYSPMPAPAQPSPQPITTATPSAMTVCFTPGANCPDAIIQALSDATHTILVQAYAFTSAPMAKARLDAHTGGVQVQVILHKSQCTEQDSSADFLSSQGEPAMIDAEHAISHHKVMMIDGEIVITGGSPSPRRRRRRTRSTC